MYQLVIVGAPNVVLSGLVHFVPCVSQSVQESISQEGIVLWYDLVAIPHDLPIYPVEEREAEGHEVCEIAIVFLLCPFGIPFHRIISPEPVMLLLTIFDTTRISFTLGSCLYFSNISIILGQVSVKLMLVGFSNRLAP